MRLIECEKTKETVNNYNEYLKTRWWGLFRTKYLKGKKNCLKCKICGGVGIFNLHHISYENLGHEKKTDVILLCQKCHHKLHEKVKEVMLKHSGRSLSSITNRCIRTTKLGIHSHYNFIWSKNGKS